jgi:hypothetical protein
LFSIDHPEGMPYHKFTQEKQVLDTVDSMRPLSSFTQPSFESKIVFMAKDSLLVICVYAMLCSEICPKNTSIPLFKTNLDSPGLLLFNTSLIPMIILAVPFLISHGSIDDKA